MLPYRLVFLSTKRELFLIFHYLKYYRNRREEHLPPLHIRSDNAY